jgi:hypothetical protein
MNAAGSRTETSGLASDVSSQEELVLARVEDLESLRWNLQHRRRRKVRVLLSPPLDVKEVRRAALERRINRLLAACGCKEGAVAGLLYLILVPTLVMGALIPHSIVNWTVAALGFVATMVVGKLAGLIVARLRLLLTLREIQLLARECR